MTNHFELLPDYVPTRKSAGRPNRNRSPLGIFQKPSIAKLSNQAAFDGKETISGYKALEEELTTAYNRQERN